VTINPGERSAPSGGVALATAVRANVAVVVDDLVVPISEEDAFDPSSSSSIGLQLGVVAAAKMCVHWCAVAKQSAHQLPSLAAVMKSQPPLTLTGLGTDNAVAFVSDETRSRFVLVYVSRANRDAMQFCYRRSTDHKLFEPHALAFSLVPMLNDVTQRPSCDGFVLDLLPEEFVAMSPSVFTYPRFLPTSVRFALLPSSQQ
jgi:hypothetical protein